MNTHRLLLVDDEPRNLRVLEGILAPLGYTLDPVGNGEKALERIKSDPPDLMLLDVMMPGISGFDVCRQVKARQETQFIPVVLVTALDDRASRVTGIESGADDFITKPVDPNELRARVKSLLRIKRLHDELQGRNAKLEQTNRALRETQARLVQSSKMASLGILAAGIAHELNTPVGSISSMHDTLIRVIDRLKETLKTHCSADYEDDQTIQRMFKVIADANRVIASGAGRVSDIVHSLQNFARLDEAQYQMVDLHEGIESTLTLLQSQLSADISVVKDYTDVGYMYVSPSQINQVFMNLLINAIQSIKSKGQIRIKTFQSNNKVHVQISDTGVGIPPEQLERIFDPGFSATNSRVKIGFGLPTAYSIIQDHKGEIQVESEVGKGTVVTIALPKSA